MLHSQLNDLYRSPSLYVLKWLKPGLAGLSWLICNQLGLARPFLVKPCLAEPSQAKLSHGNTYSACAVINFSKRKGIIMMCVKFDGIKT